MMKLLCCASLVFGLISSNSFAEKTWHIRLDESNITFTGTQNNAPVSGKFTRFSGDIDFNPDQLATSKATITVDMNSISTTYPLVAETLKTADWFDVKKFPKVIFKTVSITKTGDKTYDVNGTLNVRDKTLPLKAKLTVDHLTAADSKVTGSATLKRTAFGIGSGEWSKTTDIKDDVAIQFTISGDKK